MGARNILFLFLAGMIFFMGCSAAVESADKKAADFSLEDVNSRTVRLSDYENKVIILNFFATWCPPCRSEIPDFVELMNEYGDKDFVIIGICLENDMKVVKDFVNKYNINYPVLIDDGLVSESYGPIGSIPTTFIIDKNGDIAGKIIGAREKEFFEDAIKPLL